MRWEEGGSRKRAAQEHAVRVVRPGRPRGQQVIGDAGVREKGHARDDGSVEGIADRRPPTVRPSAVG